MLSSAFRSCALCLLLATTPGLLPAPPEAGTPQKAAELETDVRWQTTRHALKNGEVIAQQEFLIQKHGRDATADEVTMAFEQARLALLEAGMREEAESIERLRIRLQDPSNPDRDKAQGWRWTRVHRMGPKGMQGEERVGSESSGLFREMFEIDRAIEEHEARLLTLYQAKERILSDPATAPPELERLARSEAQLHEERISGLNRLRERRDRLTEAIDTAMQNLEIAPGSESPAPRADYLRNRLGAFRSALEESGGDDEQFYNALRRFALGNQQAIIRYQREPGDHPPNERVVRLEREIDILQARLRELDTELRQLRDRPMPLPRSPHAPAAAPAAQPVPAFPPPPHPPR